MTVQQVNLYASLYEEKVGIPSARQVLQAAGVAAVLMALLIAVSTFNAGLQQDKLDQTIVTQGDLETSVQALRDQYGIREKDPALEARLQALKREQESKTILLSNLSSSDFGTKSGFARHFQGLARRRVHGLWLKQIHMQRGGREMALTGLALKPEFVPRLLQLLREEPAFKGQRFSSFNMSRAEGETGDIEFQLSSTPAEEGS